MPGIAGVVQPSEPPSPQIARQLLTPLTGPGEQMQAHALGQAAFAHTAHDIQVPQGGLSRRPLFMVAASGWVVDAGSQPLADFCLGRYVEHGPEGLADLNGIYAVAIWDGRDQLLVLAQDRLGIGGLCYAQSGDQLCFATQPGALLRLHPPALDARALGQLLTVGYPMGDLTLFNGIRRLGPAGLALWRRGQLHLRRTWAPPTSTPTAGATDTRAEERAMKTLDAALAAAIDDAVDSIGADTRLVLPLSGGIDSRPLLGHARRHAQLTTCSYGDVGSRDRRYGAQLADAAGARHCGIELPADYLARFGPALVQAAAGQAGIQAAHLLCMQDELSSSPAVACCSFLGGALTGAGLPAGGPLPPTSTDVDLQGSALFEHAYRVGFDETGLTRVLRQPYANDARGAAREAFLTAYRRGDDPAARATRADFDLRQSCYGAHQFTALGLAAPTRAPFLDHRVLDSCLSWPLAWRQQQQLYRRYLCRFHPDLARVPQTSTGLPLLGPSPGVGWRRRLAEFRWRMAPGSTAPDRPLSTDRRQAPDADAIRNDAREFFTELCSEPNLPGDVFDTAHVADLLQAHLDGRVAVHHQLSAIATVAIWWQQYVQGAQYPASASDDDLAMAV